MPTSRVFITNRNAGHDYRKARAYGELVFLTEGKPPVFTTDRLLIDLDGGLAGFRPETDYLLLSGHVVVNALAAMILAWRHEDVQLLLWDAKVKRYEVRTVSGVTLREIFRAE